jgi:MerR family transcriptional regulator, light-induced transcriptional regulator
MIHQAPRRSKEHVVCACFPRDDHELGLLGASLKFRYAGWRVTFLGSRTPAEHLSHVVRVVRPHVVALSCVLDEGSEVFEQTLSELMHERVDDSKFVIGGRGAERHPDIVSALGATMVSTPDQWLEVLG